MIGQKLQEGRYEVLRRLADGWMGGEYVVYDQNRDVNLALRVLDKLDGETLAFLQQEHPTLVNLGHECLFYIFELFEEQGRWFLITDLVEESLDFWDVKAGGVLPGLERVQNVCWQIANALKYLHDNETFHGRLECSNVMVLPGDEVRVSDFGLVRKGKMECDLAERILEDWRALGGLFYLALTGRSVSEADVDLFSVPLILEQIKEGREVDENMAVNLAEICLSLLKIDSNAAADGASMVLRLKPLVDTTDSVEELLLSDLKDTVGDFERSKVVEKLVKHYTFKRRFVDAFDLASKEIETLGVLIPKKLNTLRFGWVSFLNRRILKRGKIENALRLSDLEDEKLVAALRIMHSAIISAFRIQHKQGWLLLMEAVLLCLRNGKSPEGVALIAMYGMIYRGGVKEQYVFGEEMGREVIRMTRNDSNFRVVSELEYLIGMHGKGWLHPAKEGEVWLLKAYESGRSSGNLHTARLAAVGLVMSQWMRGVRLQELWDLTEKFLPFIEESELVELPAVLRMVRQVILCFQGETPQVDCLDSEDFDEGQFLGDMVGFQYRHLAQFSYVFLANFCAAHGRLVASKIHAHLSGENIQEESSAGMLLYAEHFFQEVISNGCDQEFGTVEQFLTKALNKFQTWTSLCPENFKAKQEMIFAEDYLNMGRHSDAQSSYLQAAESAQKYDNYLVRAWAFERITSLPDGERYLDDRLQAWEDYGAITLTNRKK